MGPKTYFLMEQGLKFFRHAFKLPPLFCGHILIMFFSLRNYTPLLLGHGWVTSVAAPSLHSYHLNQIQVQMKILESELSSPEDPAHSHNLMVGQVQYNCYRYFLPEWRDMGGTEPALTQQLWNPPGPCCQSLDYRVVLCTVGVYLKPSFLVHRKNPYLQISNFLNLLSALKSWHPKSSFVISFLPSLSLSVQVDSIILKPYGLLGYWFVMHSIIQSHTHKSLQDQPCLPWAHWRAPVENTWFSSSP